MPHKRSHRRKSGSRHRKMRGGTLGNNPPSAWGWGLGTLGDGWTQFTNALTLQPGQNTITAHSNNVTPVGNINAQNPMPSQALSPSQSGGRRRSRRHLKKMRSSRKTRKHRGGSLGTILTRAAAPLVLLASQQMYKKKRSHKA